MKLIMNQNAVLYEELIEKFIQWAGTKADIRLSLIVGSRARCDHPADSWADLDIMTFTTNPKT
ncbi:MAG: aminoglycoside 6-adenylyltransferase, partial [Firmicutes bacterium]|nr:aminoglycoside 6-adenylyltransferase [Bacillota bacterium]